MTEPLLQIQQVSKSYYHKTGWFRGKRTLALEPISFSLQAGETLAIMGETGSGKSTLAKIIAGVEVPSSGQVLLRGEVLEPHNYRQRCQHIRMIFQDSLSSLNRQISIGQQLLEPLRFNSTLTSQEQQQKVVTTLRQVGLLPEHYNFYPHMLSSGQQQRVCIARAIILEPQIIVADEAFVALDPSIRAQIINLILDLQEDMGISFIFISHSAEIVKHVADKILIMHHGKLVEFGTTEALLTQPQQQLTRLLLGVE
jgi:cationic peptide transport system ATP-binding protein